MEYLHKEVTASSGDVVVVSLDSQANVRLLDAANYACYRRGEKHHCYGGFAKASPVRLKIPSAGTWHVVIDLGGYAGSVKASIKVISWR